MALIMLKVLLKNYLQIRIKKLKHFLNLNAMKKTNLQKFYLGLFVILSTLLLVLALYFIGSRQNLFGKTFRVNAIFKNVNGLQLGNNVRYSGINVGTVKQIKMVNDTTIIVNMVVEENILKHLKKNAVASISTDGLVGSMFINILPSKDTSGPLVSGDTLVSYNKVSTNDMLSTLNTTNENAALLTLDLLKITTAINEGKGTLGLLINDAQMASNLKQTVSDLKLASAGAAKTINELNAIIASVNYEQSIASVLLSDSIAAQKIETTISNFNNSSKDINTVIANLNDIVLEIKNGEGALDYMINDTTLVKNIDETLINLKDGSIRLNENLEALKHNFLFRGYFKKQEKAKQKAEKSKN
jgi:phospholipid/cholesterol/gamma-HCH transport system substrate-binding protein